MKIENRSFTWKGKKHHGTIAWPDNLQEAITLLGEREVFAAFKLGYLEVCRKQICGLTRRRRNQKIDLSDLPEQDQELVVALVADLKDANQQLRLATESAQPEPQPIVPTDSVETPEEAPAPTSEHVDPFEEDFAKYLASLDSSPQQHTETPEMRPQITANPPQSSQKGLLSRLWG